MRLLLLQPIPGLVYGLHKNISSDVGYICNLEIGGHAFVVSGLEIEADIGRVCNGVKGTGRGGSGSWG